MKKKKNRGWRVGQSTSSSPHIMDFIFWSMSLSSSSSVLALLGLVHRWMRCVVIGGVGRIEGGEIGEFTKQGTSQVMGAFRHALPQQKKKKGGGGWGEIQGASLWLVYPMSPVTVTHTNTKTLYTYQTTTEREQQWEKSYT